jgi:hypothetical protein
MLDSDRPSARSCAASTTESISCIGWPESSPAARTVSKMSSCRLRRPSAKLISSAAPSM